MPAIPRLAPLYAGVELGGTKCVALFARGAEIIRQEAIPTADPASTLDGISDRLSAWGSELGLPRALGIASFGPLVLDRRRPDFGRLSSTPKVGWAGTDLRGHFARRFADLPIAIDTDVNGAALAEGKWGAARGARVHVYLTIGTGIGGGLVIDGRAVHGRIHPEMGHVRVRRAAGDSFAGVCPYHGDCIEGLASGPAIAARAGAPAEGIPREHPVWELIAGELAELMTLLILTLSPERILIGGGVGAGSAFPLAAIRKRTAELLSAYVEGLDEPALQALIVPPGLGEKAGPLGAIALAEATSNLGVF